MQIEEVKQAMKETLTGFDKVLFTEMKTQLINSVLPELIEKIQESVLSDDKNGIKAKLIEEIAKKREEDKTYDDLLAENTSYKQQIEDRDLKLKSIEENKTIYNVLSTLEVVPHDSDLIVNLVRNSKEFIEASNSKKGITDEMLKEKILNIFETQSFLFKPQSPTMNIQWGVNPTDDIVKNNQKANPYKPQENENGFDDIKYMIKTMG